jgi:hypothetical protein
MKKAIQNSSEILQKFYCDKCDYSCSRRGDFNKHIQSVKHNATLSYKNATENSFTCNCGKNYKHSSSFYRHKKICNYEPPKSKPENMDDINEYKKLMCEAIIEMKEQRDELLNEIKKKDEMITSMVEKIGNTTNNINNNNFNINMFLNDRCKNAINFSDFIERIEISHDDLENNAQLGFVQGMTKIITDHLKQLTLYERPIHCTDVKRETLYIKDSNEWGKEQSNEKISSAIQEVSRKSIGSLLHWKQTNPDYENIDSDFSKKCVNIQVSSMAGSNKDNYHNKIIHNIAKESKIDKENI